MRINLWLLILLLFIVSSLIPFVKSESLSFGVFEDSKCDTEATKVEWGTIPNGGFVSQSVYVKNFVNQSFIAFTVEMINVKPEEAWTFLRLEGNLIQFLEKDEVVELELTLFVDSKNQNITSFNFDVVVYADYFDEDEFETMTAGSLLSEDSSYSEGSFSSARIGTRRFDSESYVIEEKPKFVISNELFVIVALGVLCFYLVGKERR